MAHRAALSAGGKTVAVLAHGLQTVAPLQHAELAEQIVATGGALVTEYAYGVEPAPPLFVRRDRIQAGLSTGVVMIQSDLDGGSLHASRATLRYGRRLAVPRPTSADIDAASPEIKANVLLAVGSDEEKMKLLQCDASALSRVRVLTSREDYDVWERELEAAGCRHWASRRTATPGGVGLVGSEKADGRDAASRRSATPRMPPVSGRLCRWKAWLLASSVPMRISAARCPIVGDPLEDRLAAGPVWRATGVSAEVVAA